MSNQIRKKHAFTVCFTEMERYPKEHIGDWMDRSETFIIDAAPKVIADHLTEIGREDDIGSIERIGHSYKYKLVTDTEAAQSLAQSYKYIDSVNDNGAVPDPSIPSFRIRTPKLGR